MCKSRRPYTQLEREKQELDIIQLMSRGRNLKEIAIELDIHVNTVVKRRKSIRNKYKR